MNPTKVAREPEEELTRVPVNGLLIGEQAASKWGSAEEQAALRADTEAERLRIED